MTSGVVRGFVRPLPFYSKTQELKKLKQQKPQISPGFVCLLSEALHGLHAPSERFGGREDLLLEGKGCFCWDVKLGVSGFQ